MWGHHGHITRPHATQFPGHGCMDDLKTELCFDSQADNLSMCVCTTRNWQMSDRLVQELNVCTVDNAAMKRKWGMWTRGTLLSVVIHKEQDRRSLPTMWSKFS